MKTDTSTCELLPWYINGTLGSEEMKDVEQHLESCQICSSEVELQMQFSRQLQSNLPAEEKVLQLKQQGLGKLREQIHQQTANSNEPASSFLSDLKQRLLDYSHSFFGYATVCGALVLMVSSFYFVQNSPDSITANDDFQLLTTPASADVHEFIIQIVFEPSTEETLIRNLLIDTQSEIIGNSTSGVYRLRLLDAGKTADSAAEKIEFIRNHDFVRWAKIEQ